METELRPLSLGEILDRTFQIYRSRFTLFAGIAVLAATIRLVFSGGLLAWNQMLLASHMTVAVRVTDALASIVSGGVSLLAIGLTFTAITFAVSQIYLERPTTIGDAYRALRLHLGRYIGLNLVCVLLPWAPFAVVGAGFTAIAAIHGGFGQPNSSGANILLLSGLVMMCAAPLCLWLASRYALANAASLSESLTIGAALRRSVTLSHGTRGRIILALIAIVLVQTAFGILFIAPFFSLLAHSGAHPPLGLIVYQLVIGFVSSVLFTPVYGIVLALFYYDARIRKEGFDVEWLLQRSEPLASSIEATATLPEILPG